MTTDNLFKPNWRLYRDASSEILDIQHIELNDWNYHLRHLGI